MRKLVAILIAMVLLMPMTSLHALDETPDDAYLRGFIDSWLVTTMGYELDRVGVEVNHGIVILHGEVDSPESINRIVGAIGSFPGVVRVENRMRIGAGDGGRWPTWLGWAQPAPGRNSVKFPVGDLFAPPLADQKQPRFHTTWQRYRSDAGSFNAASVGFGENFGLVRWPRSREGDGWQVGISGAVFALFDLDTQSNDLLNADYSFGVPLSYRSGAWSARARVFHQSSHLGDEFLLGQPMAAPIERINLSFEALELLASWEHGGYRIYGGMIRIFASDTALGRNQAEFGLEYKGNPIGWRTARLVAGLNIEAWNETGWDRDWSFKGGLQFQGPYGDARTLKVLLEYYNGRIPHGQFFTGQVEYFGLGLAYGF